MTDTDDLRNKIARALYAHRLSVGDFPDGTTSWDDPPEPWRDEWVDAAQSLLPVVREALADAWDDGWNARVKTKPGLTPDGPNPWREDQP